MATHSGMGEPHGLPSMGVHTVGTRLKQLSSSRLLGPWDSPGKKTGVGSHFLLQCMKVKSESEVAQSCPILSDPMDHSPPGSSIPGILQAGTLEWNWNHAIIVAL